MKMQQKLTPQQLMLMSLLQLPVTSLEHLLLIFENRIQELLVLAIFKHSGKHGLPVLNQAEHIKMALFFNDRRVFLS